MNTILSKKWRLTVKIVPFLLLIAVLKFLSHSYGLEILSLSSLFTAIVSANIFLIGFLISGVLVDYKESEKIPGEMASSLDAMADECSIIYKNKKSSQARKCLEFLRDFSGSLIDWFYKKEKTKNIYGKLLTFNDFFLDFEPLTQANFIARLKQEQNIIRRFVTRVHTIRETSFNIAGYAIAEAISAILIAGMIFIKIDPFYESIFFVSFVSFILIYMILLIKDLDNPFDYYDSKDEGIGGEVSLKPLYDARARIEERIEKLSDFDKKYEE